MIRRIAQLPLRVIKRALAALDGERSAPSPAPPMKDIQRPSTAAPAAPTAAAPAPTPPVEPAPATQAAAKKAPAKKAAPKKAAAKKAPAKKAAPKKAPAKKAAAKKAPAKKAASKKAAPKKAAPKKAAAKKAAAKKAPAKKAAPKKAPAKKASAKKATSAPPILVEPMETPNPNAMKFTLNQTVAETGSFSFNAGDTEIVHPVAAAVLALEDVESVFGVNDFITVSKTGSADWATLVPKVVEAIQGTA